MRRKDREITGIADILQIVEKAKILHLGLYDEAYPYVVPLHYGFEYRDNRLVFYAHSAKEGHKINLIEKNNCVCVELECDIELVSGGEIPCRYGSAYSSVIARGKAEIVVEPEEKIRGLSLLMLNQTGKEFSIDEKMASSVAVIKIVVDSFTAKARSKAKK